MAGLRSQGNEKFKFGDYESAHKLYAEAIREMLAELGIAFISTSTSLNYNLNDKLSDIENWCLQGKMRET